MGKIVSRLIVALLAVLLLLNLYTIAMRQFAGEKQPTVFGFSTAVVLSGSMEPAIHVDDMVVLRAQETYAPGEIVLYEGENSMVTHRIVGTEDGAYLTRGDANNIDDPPVPKENVVGKVVCTIPGAGKVILFLQSPLGMCLLVLVAFGLLTLPALRQRERETGNSDG